MSDELVRAADGLVADDRLGDRSTVDRLTVDRPITEQLRQRACAETARQTVYRVLGESLTVNLCSLADSDDAVDRLYAFIVALESVKVVGRDGSLIVPLSRPAVALLEATLLEENDPEIFTAAMRHASRLIDTFGSHWGTSSRDGVFRVEVEGRQRQKRLFEAFDEAVSDAMTGDDPSLARRVVLELARCPHLTPSDRSHMIAEANLDLGRSSSD